MKQPIASPLRTKEILSKYNFILKKKFGQNFLIDLNTLDEIVESSEIGKDDFVLEIGPGIGSLTEQLALNAKEVCAIEIDKALIPILEDTLKDYDNISIINEDVLKVDLKKLIEEKNNGSKVKVVANLPYYITTPIIMGLFENNVPVESITVMIQKEVADRMQAKPSTKEYGALSLAVQYYCEPSIIANVPANCFVPKPKVGSAVIRLKKYSEPPIKAKDDKFMFKIIRAGFGQRRKTLVNSMSNAGNLNISKEQIVNALNEIGVDQRIRGEALTLKQFRDISDFLME